MTIEEVKSHAMRYSQTYSSKNEYTQKSSKWSTDFDAMAKKTVVKLLLSKYAPLSVEMVSAQQADQAVITQEGTRYIDNTDMAEEVTEESAAIADQARAEAKRNKVSEAMNQATQGAQ